MPEISTFGDVEELDNRYIDKSVVYVEGEDDQKVWERIVGSDDADKLEFKVPSQGGAGYRSVLKRVREERLHNPNVHGLLDGEVAAEYGEVEQLINCTKTIFTLDGEEFDGIIFMSFHELENVLVCHSNITAFAANNVRMQNLGQVKQVDAEKQLITIARRFYIAALFKYTSAHINATGQNLDILDIANFRSDKKILTEIKYIKSIIPEDDSSSISYFMRQLFEISKMIRKHTKRNGISQKEVNIQIARLAEGKGLLIKAKQYWKIPKENEGHLVERVRNSEFARDFRDELISHTIN